MYGADRVVGTVIDAPAAGQTIQVGDSSLTGTAQFTANVVSGERELSPDERVWVRKGRVVEKSATTTSPRMFVGIRDLRQDTVSYYTTTAAHTTTGLRHFPNNLNASTGQFVRVGVNYVNGGMTSLSAAYVDFVKTGVG